MHIFQYLEVLFCSKHAGDNNDVRDPDVKTKLRTPTRERKSKLLSRNLQEEFETIYRNVYSGENRKLKVAFSQKNEQICENEKHHVKPKFDSLLEKKRHIIREHSCPLVKCSFYSEFDFELLE